MPEDYSYEINKLKDEQYCLAFELEAMSDLLLRRKTERWVHNFSDHFVEIEHAARYTWVSQFVHNKRVLDIACGIGRGSFLLASDGKAREVVGCDFDKRSIEYALIRNKFPTINYFVNDAQKFNDKNKYDLIVSFETIEHLPNASIFLECMQAVLADSGYLIISTPISSKPFDDKPDNLYHIQEWGFKEFQELLSKYFSVEKIYVQLRPNPDSAKKPFVNNLISKIKKTCSMLAQYKFTYLNSDEIMKPVEWNQEKIPVKILGKELVGFQIIKARKKFLKNNNAT